MVDGHEIPLVICNGLPYLDIRPYTDREFDTLAHVTMTSNNDWDPSVLDCDPTNTIKSTDTHDVASVHPIHENFIQFGEYMDRYVVTFTDITDPVLEEQVLPSHLRFRVQTHKT